MYNSLPVYNMSSVNGDYMNTGSKYAPNIEPIQQQDQTYYSINEDRFEETYPPIGQLVPIGGDFILVGFAILYLVIKFFKNNARISKQNHNCNI